MRRREARRLRTQRGVTLVEMLIVVAIMALVAGAVAAGVIHHWTEVRKATAATSARGVRQAVKSWWLSHESASCPSVSDLLADGLLDEDSPPRDPWGNAWHIECSNDAVTVASDGPDRQSGTADDIRVPPKRI
jgi:general secretion pathway protein G